MDTLAGGNKILRKLNDYCVFVFVFCFTFVCFVCFVVLVFFFPMLMLLATLTVTFPLFDCISLLQWP